MLKDILNLLPENINTGFLLVCLIALWRIGSILINGIKKKKESQKLFAKEVLEKERERSKFETRLNKAEEELVKIREDFEKKNLENKEDFLILTKKLDKILDILLKPINQN